MSVITHDLPCALSMKERLAKADEAGKLYAELDAAQAALDEVKKRKKGIEDQLELLNRQVAEGAIRQPVECIEEPDLSTNQMIVRRTDTNEVVKELTRTLTADELFELRQEKLPGVDARPNGKGKGKKKGANGHARG